MRANSNNQRQPKASIWNQFGKRAKDLKIVRTRDCACPPADWTINLDPDKTKR